jgi:hypothetical protein
MAQPNAGATSIVGVTKLIAPSIMQCGKGGYLAVIPGVGLMAATSMEEIMEFVQRQTMEHFADKAQRAWPKVVERTTEAIQSATKVVEPLTAIAMVGAVAVIAMLLMRSAPEPTLGLTVVKQPAALIYEVPVRGIRTHAIETKQ